MLMQERRKHQRLPIKMHLEIDKLFRQNNDQLERFNEPIELVDVSKSGVGFTCEHNLPLNYYFNAKIEFDEKTFFYCVIKIIRQEQVMDDLYKYGCEFVGLAEFLANKVDEYQKIINTI